MIERLSARVKDFDKYDWLLVVCAVIFVVSLFTGDGLVSCSVSIDSTQESTQ